MSRVITPPDVEPMLGLDQSAVVYGVGVGGDYTTVLQTALACRLVRVAETGTGPERAELAATRRFLWDGVYQLPETAQLLIASERWNVQAGSVSYMRGPTSAVEYGRAEVVRAI